MLLFNFFPFHVNYILTSRFGMLNHLVCQVFDTGNLGYLAAGAFCIILLLGSVCAIVVTTGPAVPEAFNNLL